MDRCAMIMPQYIHISRDLVPGGSCVVAALICWRILSWPLYWFWPNKWKPKQTEVLSAGRSPFPKGPYIYGSNYYAIVALHAAWPNDWPPAHFGISPTNKADSTGQKADKRSRRDLSGLLAMYQSFACAYFPQDTKNLWTVKTKLLASCLAS